LNLAGKARSLFVAGCQRSGTTAFAECLNLHPRILLDVERYRSIPARTITPELFTFERILDYREETIRPREYYEELLFRKEPEKLEWIGGKNPNYLLLRRAVREQPRSTFHRAPPSCRGGGGVVGGGIRHPRRALTRARERLRAWGRGLEQGLEEDKRVRRGG
jgi:hypothetical protein